MKSCRSRQCLSATTEAFFFARCRHTGRTRARHMKKTGMKTSWTARRGTRLSRLTHEIIEKNKGRPDRTRRDRLGGIPLSQVIRRKIQVIEGVDVPTGSSHHPLPDDLARGIPARMKRTEIPFSIDDKR